MSGWYQEGSIIDAIRGGDVKTGVDFIDKPLNSFIDDRRRDAQKKDALSGIGTKDAFGDVKTHNPIRNIFGFTEEETVKARQEVDDQEVLNTYGDKAKLYDYSLRNKDGSVKSDTEVTEFLDEREKVRDLIGSSGFDATDLNVDLNKISYEGAGSAIRQARAAEAAKLRAPAEKLAAGQLDLQKTIAANQKEANQESARFQRHQLEVEGIRAENARRERQFEAAQNRELTREQNMMQLRLANMDRADRREDRRMEREDRQAEKRQASIMMLIKGLTQLGAGFSI